jgi:hypothetical protein
MDNDLLILHALAVRKSGNAEALAEVLGIQSDVVVDVLGTATTTGLVIDARGTYMLTPSGHSRLSESYPTVFKNLRESPSFLSAYEQFEIVNRKILSLFTRWQSVTKAGTTFPNDHSDPEYDNQIIDELGVLHDRSGRIIEEFSKELERLSKYHVRLQSAYEKVLAGNTEFVSGVRIDSYHTIWFELHEDLLRMLGKARES